EKMDTSLHDAAADLGAKPWQIFVDVTLPLSMPGVIAGSLLVFIPAIGEYVIPALLGGIDSLMIGRTLYDEFFVNRDWPLASAVATILLIIVVIPIMLFQRSQQKRE
ncbi:MAG: ABC transporter permease subunit, partial [Porticoccaceae bacterium]|nr:ABC transporter permease subunit [Porticoccaceae bacterium]